MLNSGSKGNRPTAKISGQLIVAVVLVVVIIGVAAFFVLSPTSSNSSSSSRSTTPPSTTGTGASTGAPVTVVSDLLAVGAGAGIWQIQLQNSGTKPINTIEIELSAPSQTVVCTGQTMNMTFKNCPATPIQGGPLAPGATIPGFASGTAPGSAKVGSTYPLKINLVFADGTRAIVNATVTATSAG